MMASVEIIMVDEKFKSLIDSIIDVVLSFCENGKCDENIYHIIANLLVQNGFALNRCKKKLWKPFRGWPGLYTRVRNTVLRKLRELGYTPDAIILFGSMSVHNQGHDIDVAIFLNDYLSPEKLEEIEVELKATWDVKASLLHWPPLDPFVFSGYKPLLVIQ